MSHRIGSINWVNDRQESTYFRQWVSREKSVILVLCGERDNTVEIFWKYSCCSWMKFINFNTKFWYISLFGFVFINYWTMSIRFYEPYRYWQCDHLSGFITWWLYIYMITRSFIFVPFLLQFGEIENMKLHFK